MKNLMNWLVLFMCVACVSGMISGVLLIREQKKVTDLTRQVRDQQILSTAFDVALAVSNMKQDDGKYPERIELDFPKLRAYTQLPEDKELLYNTTYWPPAGTAGIVYDPCLPEVFAPSVLAVNAKGRVVGRVTIDPHWSPIRRRPAQTKK